MDENPDPEGLNAQLEQLYNSAEAASHEGLTEEAIKRCEQALLLLDQNAEEDLSFTHADFLMVSGHACWVDSDYEGAFRYYRHAYNMEAGRVDALVAMGVALFFLCRFSAAQANLELASVEEPDSGEVWYYLALMALRRGESQLADAYFDRAEELEPERKKPHFLTIDEIHAVLDKLYQRFPLDLRRALKNIPIILEERPSEALLHSQHPPLDPLVLGIFDGVPLGEQSSDILSGGLTRIILFAENIALVAHDMDTLEEELEVTLKHEIGHFLGLDEDELAARGLD